MISSKVADRINLQIEREIHSAYLYLAMSTQMTKVGYDGTAKWLMIQYHEEMFHAMKFRKYLIEQGASPKVTAIPEFVSEEKDLKSVFTRVLEHEKFVTASIKELMDLADAEKDYATMGLVQWYVDEQVEEEKNASDTLRTLDLLGASAHGAFLLNIELGKRDLSVASDFTKV